MANIPHSKLNSSNKQYSQNRAPLDTLAQLSHDNPKSKDNGHKKLIKRQIAKSITLGQLFPLIDENSPLKKSYWNTYHCNKVLIQEGYKYTTSYCSNRWCTVCNRIRMGKMINAYSAPMSDFSDMHFVTLTAPNVVDILLKDEIDRFQSRWRKIYKHLKNINRKLKRKNDKRTKESKKIPLLDLRGMRKLECTYQPKGDTYNPHFHFIFSNRHLSNIVVRLWLKYTPCALRKAQNIKKADDKTLLELFKYTVKGVHKGKLYPKALDTIFQALYSRQTYSPIGIRKVVEEDIEGIQSQELSFKGFREDMWRWSNECKDWVNDDGELLTEYMIEGKLSDWIDDLTCELIEPRQEQNTIVLNRSVAEKSKWIFYSEMTDDLFNSS